MTTRVNKNAKGHGYTYTDLAQIHEYLEERGMSYYQYIEVIDGHDYVYTVPIINGEEKTPRRGCRVAQATLIKVNNPAQEQGSALTYARRYSLLMAFGLATEDDDAQALSQPKTKAQVKPAQPQVQAKAEEKQETNNAVAIYGEFLKLVYGDKNRLNNYLKVKCDLKNINDLGTLSDARIDEIKKELENM